MSYFIFSLLLCLASPSARIVNVEVTAPTTGGRIYVAAYASQDEFSNDKYVANASEPLGERLRRAEVDLPVPAAGEYVFAAFQDLNGNGELDLNLFGVPTEPYGFGKLPPSKWRAPNFGEVATRIEGEQRIRIEVRRWSEY
jgi:uncharacterized protein (DUF2141 family)